MRKDSETKRGHCVLFSPFDFVEILLAKHGATFVPNCSEGGARARQEKRGEKRREIGVGERVK
jgi:hypothetical protein